MKVRFNESTKSVAHLFYKPMPENNLLDDPTLIDMSRRSLVVHGIPPYYDATAVSNVFGIYGKIEHVEFSDRHLVNPYRFYIEATKSQSSSHFSAPNDIGFKYKIAYILFAQPQSIERAINKPVEKERLASTKENPIRTGFKTWIDEYRRRFVSEEKLTKEINEFMAKFEKEKAMVK